MTSRKGNPWARLEDCTVTCFPAQGGWKVCLAPSSREQHFSDAYPTVEDAKRAAVGAVRRYRLSRVAT